MKAYTSTVNTSTACCCSYYSVGFKSLFYFLAMVKPYKEVTPGLVEPAVQHSGWMMFSVGVMKPVLHHAVILVGEKKTVVYLRQLK